MHRIDTTGHVGNMFVDEDYQAGTPGTVCDAAFFNAVQEEIANAVEGSGQTLDKLDHTQLLKALPTLAAAAPPMMIPLLHWQTDADAATVGRQDEADSDGHGSDLFYRYVFPAAVTSYMYCQQKMMFGGYDLQLSLDYRTASANAGNIFWVIDCFAIMASDTQAEIASNAEFGAAISTHSGVTRSKALTPSPSQDVWNTITGTDIVIPSSAYSSGDLLFIRLYRYGSHANDTHTGNAEVADSICLKPVLPS